MELNVYNNVRVRALLTGILCGIAGVAVDIDHIPAYIFNIQVSTIYIQTGLFDTLRFGASRPIHPAILYISLIAIACLGGLLFQYSIRTFVKDTATAVITTAQKVLAPTPAAK